MQKMMFNGFMALFSTIPYRSNAEEAGRLATPGVGTRPFFWPMHEQPVLRQMNLFGNEQHPCAERLARRGFYLPSGFAPTDQHIEAVADAVSKAPSLSA